MSKAELPIPTERWKGPPEGPPDDVPPTGSGCSAASLMIFGAMLVVPALFTLIYDLIAIKWTTGPVLYLFVFGLLSGSVGATLMSLARRRLSAWKQAKTRDSPDRPRSGCTAPLMASIGAFLLLPGLCSFVVGLPLLGGPWPGTFESTDFLMTFLEGLLSGSIGGGMIWWVAVRPPATIGILMVAGIVLLVPALYFVALGLSRLDLAAHDHARWFLLGLPVGATLIWAAPRGPRA